MYIELLLFNNFAIDLALLAATQIFRRKPLCKYGVATAATVGAFISAAYGVMPLALRIATRVALAPAMCAILFVASDLCPFCDGNKRLFKQKTGILIGDFISTLFIFVLLTFLAGGAVMGLSQLIGIDLNSTAAPGLVAAGVMTTLLFAKATSTRRVAKNATCAALVSFNGCETSLSALKDSGNNLTDSSGTPVFIMSKRAARALNLKPCGKISVRTVNGDGSMPTARPDYIEVDGRRYSALCAVADKDLGDCDIILQHSLFNG